MYLVTRSSGHEFKKKKGLVVIGTQIPPPFPNQWLLEFASQCN